MANDGHLTLTVSVDTELLQSLIALATAWRARLIIRDPLRLAGIE